ncbi:oligopeptide/dipeptide ABC transporter, ATPase subunit [Alkaliphilus metalliredigens QYMF]|uniref:Oligopeptide/dipeptide ABC transporter, ATPase subunit n=1 Tax=Alkaliphilus metalliredigens (strain QYMF) TaxID=293826 RepID=A6TMB3_ALKMQ|nr:ABC transporter ATP-binding protein [Alkaliphilus metalliredigens]ABR47331.1 oligopeptide/dipeptide ABC transporter, ATPase subunit [Alkaliphilus metalliredigens QYMF]
MESLLQIKDLTVGYGNIEIVKDINFTLKRGEILGIVGESGCGKSTLLKAIMQLSGTGVVTKKGSILFEGTDMLSISKEELRRIRGNRLGVVFQNPGGSLNPLRKIKHQFIETMQSHRKINKKEAYKSILNILSRLDLEDGERILNSFPFELSGGMNQRVAIALAMIMEPELILADEPTSALDVTVQVQVVEELLKLRERFFTSIIMITHNMGVVAKIADKIGVMYAGEMVEYGEKNQILETPIHPYTKALLAAIPKIDGKMPQGLPGRPFVFGESHKGCRFLSRCNCFSKECQEKTNHVSFVEKEHWSTCIKLDGVKSYGYSSIRSS